MKKKPGAKKNEVMGWCDGVLHVRVKAPPVEGAANREVVKLLAKYFGGLFCSGVLVSSQHPFVFKNSRT